MADDVWVFAEHQGGKIRKVVLELLGAGRTLADTLKGRLCAVVLGSGVDETAQHLGRYADLVYVWDDPQLEYYNSDCYLPLFTECIDREKPAIILAGATYVARDFFPCLAGRLDTGIVIDCLHMEVTDGGRLILRKPFYGGRVLGDVVCPDCRPQIVLVRPNTYPVSGPRDARGEILAQETLLDSEDIRLKVEDVVMSARERLDLTEAEIIVTGGRGLKGPEHFTIVEELAEVLGATVGTTRAVVDSGWRPHSDQVGKSGKTVSPRLYVAAGASGAIHHIMGMDTAKVVVAINTDPRAPFFQYADYGIAGDLFEVIPLLTEEFRKELVDNNEG